MPQLPIPYYVLFLIILIAVSTDLKARKIYNLLTFPGMLLGIALNMLIVSKAAPLAGLWFSLQGLLFGILIFFIPFALGGLGAGDLKLLGVIGAFGGLNFVLWAGLYSAIAGGVISLLIILFDRTKLKVTGRFFKNLLNSLLYQIKITPPEKENIAGRRFPYSFAVLTGTILAILFQL
ncbi:prepilin peptidase [Candidatus Margulisiibacteriota bacterium]